MKLIGEMKMPKSLMGLIVTALVVLGIVYGYNRFSGKNIVDLGKK